MKVTMQHKISGTRDGVEWPERGEEIDLPADEAAALISQGSAVASKDAKKAEPDSGLTKAKATGRTRKATAKPSGETR